MRDPKWYIGHGRHDPTNEQQRKEHPYDFIDFPDNIRKQSINPYTHYTHGENSWSGSLEYIIVLEAPLHLGNGVYNFGQDCGFMDECVVQGISRRDGNPIVPGSSLKGAIRCVYEAVTKSCVRCHKHSYTTMWSKDRNRSKLPQKFLPDVRQNYGTVKIMAGLPQQQTTCTNIAYCHDHNVCPACALFGTLGWLGRVLFYDADLYVEKNKGDHPISVPILQSPQAHRIGRNFQVVGYQGTVTDLEGRKFYYKSPFIKGNCPWDYVAAESVFGAKIQFENVQPVEIGALLISMGIGESNHPILLGGGKNIGFGRTKIHASKLTIWGNMTKWDSANQVYQDQNLVSKVEECKKLYYTWASAYVSGLEQYRTIINTTITTE